VIVTAKHRYRRRNEWPGIVLRIRGRWCRITRPPYGMQIL
jgi:hypothetical protein